MAAYSEDELCRAVERYNLAFGSSVTLLKDQQREALLALSAGRDCMCSLPTGFGKSLIYELLPFLNPDCFVIVIVPLDAIIEQQIDKLGNKAISLKTELKEELKNLKCGTMNYLFCHPEQITDNKELNTVFCSPLFIKRTIYVVIDEAHCVLEWGQDFRPDYKKLFQLRSIFNCTVLTLSATVTETARKEICQLLLLKNPVIVNTSPSQDNITLLVKSRPSPSAKGNTASTPYHYICEPLINDLKEHMDTFPLTIVYFKTMEWIGYVYEMALRLLGDHFMADGQPRVVMFHSSMEKDSGKLKTMILESLKRRPEDCQIKLVLSTVALGMGADLKYVTRVIHAGPPNNLETYVQEIGRAGRSGAAAEAILYYNKGDIAVKSMRPEMREYCLNNEKCRRSVINSYFGFNSEQKVDVCCDICAPTLGLEWDFGKIGLNQE